ncbi:MAG: methylmalonyl Co-A mutase-associated GTPase MeaB [Saprospiraceae bacterium]
MLPARDKIVERIRRKQYSLEEYLIGIRAGDKVVLSQAITLVESSLLSDKSLIEDLIQACYGFEAKSKRIGITGSPGVGKSTFIESYGQLLIREGHRVAVLAIDPSSPLSMGSILGDKTRMDSLAREEAAFIRPTAAGISLGGVARKTREVMILCEAAGYDHILIETVGVGQSETMVRSMTDLFLLLIQPGAGDSLQGIKRGIVELADLICVSKADGELLEVARDARSQYEQAVHFLQKKEFGWETKVILSSSVLPDGLKTVHLAIQEYMTFMQESERLKTMRAEQLKFWLHETWRVAILDRYLQSSGFQDAMQNAENQVINGVWSPFYAADQMLNF